MFRKLPFLSLPLLMWVVRLFSQDLDYDRLPVIDYSIPREYEIADIRVSGVEFLQPQVLISISGLKVGDLIKVPGDEITRALDKFWDQGLFADAKISAWKIENRKIYLDIYLKEQPRLSKLIVDGLKKGETQDLMEKLNVRTGSQVTKDLLNNTERLIKDHFIEKGFFNTSVDIRQEQDTLRANSVRLYITFEGNQVYDDKRLRRLLKNTKKVNMNFFKASKFIRNDYKEDKQKLIEFYNENGYRDAKILGDSLIYLPEEERLLLKIFMEEGNKYYFRNIRWIGNTIYPAEILNAVLGIEKGDVFDQSLLSKRLPVPGQRVPFLFSGSG
jgi:outer membrane protein insertion porin family